MSLSFLALASSSAGCSYLLSGGGASQPILIDAGIRFDEIQRGIGFQVSNLAGCLVSHGHGDHIKAVPQLLRHAVPVYGSLETIQHVSADQSSYAKSMKPRTEYKVGDWSVLPFEAIHDLPGTFGFIIGSPDGCRALYLTDSAYSPYKFEGLTHIFVECNFSSEILRHNVETKAIDPQRYARTQRTHMSIERLEGMLKSNDLSQVQEIHLLHLSNANSDEREFKERIQRLTGKPVYVADERSEAISW